MFKDKIAVVTGGARGIGKTICESFKSEGAGVCLIDKLQNEYFTGDISEEKTLRLFADKVIAQYGKIDFLINNACLSLGGLEDCSYDDFNYVLRTGVAAPFMLTKLFMNYFAPGACIINISSSRDRMSQPNTESYTSAKGGISALTHALAVSLSGRVRVNSISPGWIDISGSDSEKADKADKAQHPAGRIGKPEDIAEMVLFLCSERAGFVTGENIAVDGGMTKMMIYHNNYGWKYEMK